MKISFKPEIGLKLGSCVKCDFQQWLHIIWTRNTLFPQRPIPMYKEREIGLINILLQDKRNNTQKHFFIRKLCLWQIASLSNWTCSFPSFYSEVLVDQSFMCMDALDCFQTHILMILCRKFCILSQVYSQIWAWPSNTLSFFYWLHQTELAWFHFWQKKSISLDATIITLRLS